MEAEMSNLLSGLFGTIIGSIISYIGVKTTTKKQIDNQNAIFERQIKEQSEVREKDDRDRINKSAALLCVEMMNWILDSIRFYNNVYRSQNTFRPLEFNHNYRDYLQEIMKLIKFEDMERIIQFYGITEKIHYNLINNNNTTNTLGNEVISSYSLLMNLFLPKEKFEYYHNIAPVSITKDAVMLDLKNEFRELLVKLEEISEMDLKIINN